MATGSKTRLRVEALTKRYARTLAVDSLSFEVASGEVLGLVGPNGAGKTTTLRSIAGVLPLRQGRVEIAGIDLARDEVRAKRALGWVPDDPVAFDSLTVDEHIELTARLFEIRDWRERAEHLLVRFELAEKRHALGGELSRGMRQKLALVCAWLPEPRVVLLDEPLSGLDPRAMRTARDAILEIVARGASVVLSSHLLDLVEKLADRIVVMDRGRKVFDGSLAQARSSMRIDPGSSLEEIFLAVTATQEADMAI